MSESVHPFSQEATLVRVGGIYEHYKGKRYKIFGIARHSETLEELVIYQALYGEGDLWARPLRLFLETVYIDQIERPRFKHVCS
jgi:hypothetical protein